jgi:hypothetical protein
MSSWSKFVGGLKALVHKGEAEQNMEDELRVFLDVAAERKIRAGMSETEARRAARLEIGSIESVKDKVRDAGWETAVEALWADIRYSIRILRKSPLFTAVVVLTLALGIGANTAIFSIFDSLILKTLPVEKPDELVQMDTSFTNPLWEQLRDRQDLFAGAFAWGSEDFNLSNGGPVHTTPAASGSAVTCFVRWDCAQPQAAFRRRLTTAAAALPSRCLATISGSRVTAATPPR